MAPTTNKKTEKPSRKRIVYATATGYGMMTVKVRWVAERKFQQKIVSNAGVKMENGAEGGDFRRETSVKTAAVVVKSELEEAEGSMAEVVEAPQRFVCRRQKDKYCGRSFKYKKGLLSHKRRDHDGRKH